MKSKYNFTYLTYLFLSLISLFLFNDTPRFSILVSSLFLIIYIIIVLDNKKAFLLFIFPFLIFFISLFNDKNFLSLGDNEGYYGPLMDTLPFYGKAQDNTRFISNLTSFDGLQYLKLGFLPVILVPDFLYKVDSELIYYYFQSFYFLILVSYIVFYINKYKLIEHNYFLYFIFFLLLSPSTILLGIAPTRHYFTLFSVLLFYFSFLCYNKNNKEKKYLLVLLLSIIFTIISKAGYILSYLIFIIIYYRKEFKIKQTYLNLIYLFSICVAIFFTIFLLPRYNDITATGLSSFNWLLKIPILGPFSKYIFDILSPFPHYNFIQLSDEVYGGNLIFFFCHILGIIYAFVVIINLLNYLFKLKAYEKFDTMTMFGCIMSLTILPASAGFNGYISIFYPFFIYYFFKKNILRKLFFSITVLTIFNILFYTVSFLR